MKIKLVILLLITLFSFQSASASHGWGGDVTWRCLPNGQYVFNLRIHQICTGLPCPLGPLQLSVLNHPNLTSITMNKVFPSNFNGPQGCGNCALPVPGVIESCTYESDSITIAGVPPDSGWVFQWWACCRSPQLSNIVNAGSQGTLYKAVMYPYNMKNTNPAFDSSPQFLNAPQTIFCAGIPQSFHTGTIEPDGDSLVYSFESILDQAQIIAYTAGYSPTSPLPGPTQNPNNVAASINPSTGLVTFTSFTIGSFAIMIKVESYKCGVKVSEVYRDYTIEIATGADCQLISGLDNYPPLITAPFIDGSGQFTLFSDTVLVGDSVLFQNTFTDPDPSPTGLQNISLDVTSLVLPNADLAPGAPCPLPPCATFSPSLPVTSVPFSFVTTTNWITDCAHLTTKESCIELSRQIDFALKYQDDHCNIPGYADRIISVIVKDLQPAASPQLDSMNILPNGDVELFWNTPTDPNGVFTTYYIYYANDSLGPYTLLDSISTFSQTTYTHVGAMGNTLLGYYKMSSKSSILCQANYEAPSANRITNFSIITGLSNPDITSNILIYPNPAINILNIQSSLFLQQKTTIEINNLLGQLVESVETKKNEVQSINTKDYKSGVYIISIIADNNKALHKRFVKH